MIGRAAKKLSVLFLLQCILSAKLLLIFRYTWNGILTIEYRSKRFTAPFNVKLTLMSL